jgi:hypothetical protein
MTAYDVLDEATIAATPAEIVQALLDEAAGRRQWWQPSLRMRQRGDRPPTEIGAVVDITGTGGGLAQRWATVRFPGRVTAFEPERRRVLDYFDGDFRGTAEWTLSPAGPGHTHIAVRFRADPHGRGAAAGQVRRRAQHQHQRHAGGVPRHRAARRRE